MKSLHQTVLLNETLHYWVTDPNGIYIDATFGRGGHTQALLAQLGKDARVLGIDQDEAAVAYAKACIHDDRFMIEHGSFTTLIDLAKKYDWLHKVSGILLDIGVSSPQLDVAERGFSFMQDGPLDMRMNQQQSLSAREWIQNAKEEELAFVFRTYGEERFATRIARAICDARKEHAITRTKELAVIVAKANPNWEKHKHPATRVFQAIRIFINDELNALKRALCEAMEILCVGGRLLVISFHSLEDRIVKHYFREQSQGRALPSGLPLSDQAIRSHGGEKKLKLLSKAIKASEQEIRENPRARSAVLRIAEKRLI